MRSLVLSLVLGIAALATLAAPSTADAEHWQGYAGPGRQWQGGSHWRGGSHFYWRGGSHWRGGSRYYYNSGFYGGYGAPSYGGVIYSPPVYAYPPGVSVYYNSGYRVIYP